MIPIVMEDDVIPTFEILTRKAVKPSESEIAKNPRARSARMRAALKKGEPQ